MTALSQIEKALEKRMVSVGMDLEAVNRELSFANQAIASDQYLQKCGKQSLAAAVVNIANIGLTLNPIAKEACLIARLNRKTNDYEATLMPMYPGLVKLATQAGGVTAIITNVVYENDQFEIDLVDNINPVKSHRPELRKSKRGDKLGAYSIATLADGRRQAEWMDIEDIRGIRDQADSWKNEKGRQYSPWFRFEDEMIRKTVLKRLCKYLPRTNNATQKYFDAAVDLDNQDYEISMNQMNKIENLLMSANISQERQQEIWRGMSGYSRSEASSVIEMLLDNQIDDVRYNGSRGSQAEISRSVKAAAEDKKR